MTEPAAFAVERWLQSREGQAYLRARLRQRGLPASLDTDVERRVAGEAERYVARGGVIEHPEAWARLRVASRVVDLVRGRLGFEPVDTTAEPVDPEPGPDELASVEVGPDAVDGVRHALAVGDDPGWVVAAALAVLAQACDGATAPAWCPQPRAGATTHEAAQWVGLWYGGRRDCFDGNAAAVRKRRSRAAAVVLARLAAAL